MPVIGTATPLQRPPSQACSAPLPRPLPPRPRATATAPLTVRTTPRLTATARRPTTATTVVHGGTAGTAATGIVNNNVPVCTLSHWRRPVGGAFSLRTAAKPLTHRQHVPVYACGMTDSLDRLYQQVLSVKDADPSVSRTARLLRAGRGKMAKKMAEEAVEVVIDAVHGDREAIVRESADLLYNLVVLWVASDLRPADVWGEMRRREELMGIAEKLPKNGVDSRRKVVLLDARRSRKRR